MEKEDPYKQKKLSETAELWRDGLFLTFWLCLFFSVILGHYHNDNATWALLNCTAIAMGAWACLPWIIDKFSSKRKEKDADN